MQSYQVVFAKWSDGYYYPGTIWEVFSDSARVDFFDGDSEKIALDHIISLEEGFDILELQANYKHKGMFFKVKLKSREPLRVKYYMDGEMETVELVQLRGLKEGERGKGFFGHRRK
ncbi:MAG: hypothetical protein FWC69_05400 [Defluviitaleaceae bacterium]|nr:hypothetical protein [Defluviitaleaceae bacterium]